MAAGKPRRGGESRGGSAEDRRTQRLNLMLRYLIGSSPWGELYTRCVHCKQRILVLENCDHPGHYRMERDKKITKKNGGRYTLGNLQPSCSECNIARSDNEDWVHPSKREPVGAN